MSETTPKEPRTGRDSRRRRVAGMGIERSDPRSPEDPANGTSHRVSDKLVGRMSLYRRLLRDLSLQGGTGIYSHNLALWTGGSAAQVRRDLMTIGFSGSPVKGYDVRQLTERIGEFLDAPAAQTAALVGVGNLGRAILSYFDDRRPKLSIAAAFDVDAEKVDRVIHGCRCHPLKEMPRVMAEHGVSVGIITVPAGQAQAVADQLIAAGARALVNFSPIRLHVPPQVFVEEIDMTTSLERAAYFARAQGWNRGRRHHP
jgi:redox-sensing transcriptional repressor